MVMGHNIHRPKIRIPRLNMNDLNLLMQNTGQVAALQNDGRLATVPEPVGQENPDVPMEADVQDGQAEVHLTFNNRIRTARGGAPVGLSYPFSRQVGIHVTSFFNITY